MSGIPLVLISGALGTGKTTLVRSLVAANPDVRFGVIVNEFGEVGVDGDLLRPTVPQIVEIRNGCICCATQEQLIPAVREVLSRYAVDVVIVEMSGAGDPIPALRNLSLLEPIVSPRKHVTLIDATADPDAVTREHMFRNSLAIADMAIMTKPDVATPAAQRRWRAFLQGFARTIAIAEAVQGEIALHAVLAPPKKQHSGFVATEVEHAPHRLASICHFITRTSSDRLRAFAQRYGGSVERFKGILWVDDVLTEVHGVRGHLTLAPCSQLPSRGRLVFISRAFDEETLRAAVVVCLGADEVPRFDGSSERMALAAPSVIVAPSIVTA
jgi:G3E family GTPase